MTTKIITSERPEVEVKTVRHGYLNQEDRDQTEWRIRFHHRMPEGVLEEELLTYLGGAIDVEYRWWEITL